MCYQRDEHYIQEHDEKKRQQETEQVTDEGIGLDARLPVPVETYPIRLAMDVS